jgi:hypothetical protein
LFFESSYVALLLETITFGLKHYFSLGRVGIDMARAVEQIERDIAALQASVAALADDLQSAYSQYLTGLGQALRRQLISACYYLCTQSYPEQFISLSVNQRQELQQALQQLADETQTQLMQQLHPPKVVNASDLSNLARLIDKEELERILANAAESSGFMDDEDDDEEDMDEMDEMDEEEREDRFATTTSPVILSMELSAIKLPLLPTLFSSAASESIASDPNRPLIPKDVGYWLEMLERAIASVLATTSHAANRLLQKSQILPNQLPEAFLEMASKTGMATESTSGQPNILNLLIEANSESKEFPSVARVMAIRLRLSEIEFSDVTSINLRSKIRSLGARLSQLNQDYQRKQKEMAIAQAEHAWRASWYEK